MEKSSPSPQNTARILRACERRYDRLRRRLARVGYLAMGTVSVSRLRCGNPDCRPHGRWSLFYFPAGWSFHVGDEVNSASLRGHPSRTA
jgi:hypothetical protein